MPVSWLLLGGREGGLGLQPVRAPPAAALRPGTRRGRLPGECWHVRSLRRRLPEHGLQPVQPAEAGGAVPAALRSLPGTRCLVFCAWKALTWLGALLAGSWGLWGVSVFGISGLADSAACVLLSHALSVRVVRRCLYGSV